MNARTRRRIENATLGLTTGVALVDLVWVVPMNGPAVRQDGPAYTRTHQHAVRLAGTAAPVLALPTLVGYALLVADRRCAARAAPWVVAAGCLLANAGLTFAVNVPINRVFARGAGCLPPDWPRLRRRWLDAHNLRSAVQVVGLAAAIVGHRRPPG